MQIEPPNPTSERSVEGVYSLVDLARGLECGGREFESSLRPNFLRKGSYATGKNCLKFSHNLTHAISVNTETTKQAK